MGRIEPFPVDSETQTRTTLRGIYPPWSTPILSYFSGALSPSLTISFDVRAYEVGPSGLLSPLVLCDYLQEAAGVHARELGVEFPVSAGGPGAWVLGRLRVAVERLPAHGETVDVETWPAAEDGLRAERDYLVHMGDEIIARGVSEWLILDIARRRPARLPPEVRALPLPERPRALPPAAEPAVAAVEHRGSFAVRRSDLDRVGHANNVRFVEWALESVPAGWWDSHILAAIDIRYRAEAVYGDLIAVDLGKAGPDTLAHNIRRGRDGVVLAVAQTQWTEA